MLCCKPLMDVTRRQVLGLGVVALGALRLPSPALAATSGPNLFELAARRHRRPRGRRTLAHEHGDRRSPPLRPRRPPLEPRHAPPGPGPRAYRGRPLDGLDRAPAEPRRRRPRHRSRLHRHRRRTAVTPARGRARPEAPVRPRAPARARAQGPGITSPVHRSARQLGRRAGPAPLGAELRHRADGVRAPHGGHDRVRARGFAGHRARHRPLSPRLQRLERHRLQLPRRPLRRDLRGPRGRDRRGRRRRPGPGLQQPVDRHRDARDVHQHPARRAGDGGAREAARLEALAARRCRPRAP